MKDQKFVYLVEKTWIDIGIERVKMPPVVKGCFSTMDLATFFVGSQCGIISSRNKKYDTRVSIYSDNFSQKEIDKNLVQATIVTVYDKEDPNKIITQYQYNIYKHPFYTETVNIC